MEVHQSEALKNGVRVVGDKLSGIRLEGIQADNLHQYQNNHKVQRDLYYEAEKISKADMQRHKKSACCKMILLLIFMVLILLFNLWQFYNATIIKKEYDSLLFPLKLTLLDLKFLKATKELREILKILQIMI
jgi:hypothetical protein